MTLALWLAASENPLGHIADKPIFHIGAVTVTQHMMTLFVVTALLIAGLLHAARRIATGAESEGVDRYITTGAFSHMIEVVCVFLRDEVCKPLLGGATDVFMPYLWTVFFFILLNNLFGLLPILDLQYMFGALVFGDPHWAYVGGTATGNIAVTAALAIIAFAIIQINGLKTLGVKEWLKTFLGGAPPALAVIMVPVEIMSMFVKPFALCVRLFANMVAGHTLLATLMMFTGMAIKGLGLLGSPISIVSIVAAIPLMFLELLVAFIQAFVFMFLAAVFIGQLMHSHGGGGESHEKAVAPA